MTPERFDCADVDGVFCIRFTTTDWQNPTIVTHYWPTVCRTYDVLRHFFDGVAPESRAACIGKLTCRRSMPGEYFVGIKADYGATWQSGKHIRLLDGGHTQPVRTETREAIMPKVRKGIMVYWSGGAWVKHTKTRKPERICPLACV